VHTGAMVSSRTVTAAHNPAARTPAREIELPATRDSSCAAEREHAEWMCYTAMLPADMCSSFVLAIVFCMGLGSLGGHEATHDPIGCSHAAVPRHRRRSWRDQR